MVHVFPDSENADIFDVRDYRLELLRAERVKEFVSAGYSADVADLLSNLEQHMADGNPRTFAEYQRLLRNSSVD